MPLVYCSGSSLRPATTACRLRFMMASHVVETQEFDKLYQRLGIEITERGESFYNPMLPVRTPLPTQPRLAPTAQHTSQLQTLNPNPAPAAALCRDP